MHPNSEDPQSAFASQVVVPGEVDDCVGANERLNDQPCAQPPELITSPNVYDHAARGAERPLPKTHSRARVHRMVRRLYPR